MFLFNPLILRVICQSWHRIYIPLCFYLICTYIISTYSTFYIYIPLCFYLIYLSLHQLRCMMNYLHSTMFLFNRPPLHIAQKMTDHIYIPLCFYLIPCIKYAYITITCFTKFVYRLPSTLQNQQSLCLIIIKSNKYLIVELSHFLPL